MLAADAAIELVHLATNRRVRPLNRAMDYAISVDGEAEAVAFAKRVIAAARGPVVSLLQEAWGIS